MQERDIISINQDRCNGCGQCVLDCAEGAIAIINGKATVISDSYCDGLGACLSGCPRNALTIIRRKAVPFDEAAAMEHVAAQEAAGKRRPGHGHAGPGQEARGCPSATAKVLAAPGTAPAGTLSADRAGLEPPSAPARPLGRQAAGLLAPMARTWPIKLRLMPASAPFLKNADLFLVADCAPAASVHFHEWDRDRVVLLACPKFEDRADMLGRLQGILAQASPKSLTVLRMEVPCCRGLASVCQEACQGLGEDFRPREMVLGCDGELRQA